MTIKRTIPFLLLNIIVSAAVVLAILYFWDRYQTEQQAIATATSVAATAPAATAEAIATASVPTLTPTSAQVRHIVKGGETLGSIAEQYDVPWEDIAQFNELENPNILSVGSELLIPIGGLPTVTPEPTVSPTSAAPPTPIPTEPPAAGEGKLAIREVSGLGNLENEALVIANEGERRVELRDWKIEDDQGNAYVFEPFILFGDSELRLHTKVGANTTSDLYWGLTYAAWEPGETVTLRDADGAVRATFSIP